MFQAFRSRLLLLTVTALLLTAIVPLLLLGVLGLRAYREYAADDIDITTELLTDRSLDLLEGRASDAATALAAFLRQRDADLIALAGLPVTPESYLQFAQAQQSQVWTLNPQREEVFLTLPLYREVAFIDLNGQEVVKAESVCFDYPWDCAIEPALELLNISDPTQRRFPVEDYFAAAQSLAAGEIYVSRPLGEYIPPAESYKSAQSPAGRRFEGFMRYIMPVESANGQRTGYVTFALDHTHVMEFVAHLDPTALRPLVAIDPLPDNLTYIIGADGSAIAHPAHHNIPGFNARGEPVALINPNNLNGPGNFYAMGFLSPVFPQLMDTVARQSQGIVARYEINGLPRSLAYATIPYFTGPTYNTERGFGFVVMAANADALRVEVEVFNRQLADAQRALIGQFASFLALSIGLVGLVTLVVSGGIVAPIRRLTAFSRLMEQRRLNREEIERLKHTVGRGEIVQLAHTFGTMAETVQQREQQVADLLRQTDQSLQQRVRELTTLGQVGAQLTSTLELSVILKAAADALLETTQAGAVRLSIAAFKPDAPPLVVVSGDETRFAAAIAVQTIPLEVDQQPIGRFEIAAASLAGVEQVFTDQVANWVSIALKNARLFDELQEKQMQVEAVNRELKETSQLKSQFLSTMSHELRTPLNAILGFCGIMLEGMGGEIDDDARHMLKRIEANSQRLLLLINDILDIAKIEAGRLDLHITPFRPHELAEQWRLQMSVLAEQRNLSFEIIEAPTVPPQFYGDSSRITQIVTNLLSNAFKFTEVGAVMLKSDWVNDHWMIQVTDTGIGIPPHALQFIFDEFRQVDGTSRRTHGGTGLGLAICRNLVVMMNGTIRVESELNQGSTFTVMLPLPTSAEALARPRSTSGVIVRKETETS